MKKITGSILLLVIGFSTNAQIIKHGKAKKTEELENFQKVEQPYEFKKHDMVQLNIFDMVFTDISVAYEHFSKDGNKGYQLPLSFNAGGLPDTNDYSTGNSGRFVASRNRIFQVGFNYNYYFNGQDKVSPYMGVGFDIGAFNYWKYNHVYQNNPYGGNYYVIVSPGEKMVGNNYSGALFGGILFNPRETVTFNLKAGFGLRRYSTVYTEYTVPFGVLEICLGFKFN